MFMSLEKNSFYVIIDKYKEELMGVVEIKRLSLTIF